MELLEGEGFTSGSYLVLTAFTISKYTKLKDKKEIENAIKEITGEEVDLIASGRTDAGVHALRPNS